MTVLFLDLADFTSINSKYGHAFGDFVLRELARRVETVSRESDVTARYGGQEFAIALSQANADQGVSLAKRIHSAIDDQPILYADEEVWLGTCVGIAECDPGFIESEEDLLQRAKQALVQAKKLGPGSMLCWDELANSSQSDLQLDSDSVEQMTERFDQLNQRLRKAYIESTEALVAAVEAKDHHTKRHSLNVAVYVGALCKQLQQDQHFIDIIETAAILHDIGKIGIPDYPDQAGQADRRRVPSDPPAPHDCRADSPARKLSEKRAAHDLAPSRMVQRVGIPRRSGRRKDPVRREDLAGSRLDRSHAVDSKL
jgi:diguanylate cyclase (GGDEF)-like protein